MAENKLRKTPDGDVVAFPADMSDEEIVSVMASQYPREVPKSKSLETEMGDQAKGDWGTGLSTGIANSASKTVRGIGTLLPQAASDWLERKGVIPSARDMKLLQAGTDASGAAKTGEVIMDVGTELMPFAKGMEGVKTAKEALMRAPAIGAAMGFVRGQDGERLKDTGVGAAGGLAGELGGRGLALALSKAMPASESTKFLLSRQPAVAGEPQIVPSIGAGADTSTWRGKAANFMEGQMESMPFVGMPIRAAKKQSSDQLFKEAAHLGTVPGGSVPAGTRADVVKQLSRDAEEAVNASLYGTRMPMRAPQMKQMDAYLDKHAANMGVDAATLDALKADIKGRLFGISPNGVMSANTVDNVLKDLYKGIGPARNNTNAQQLVSGLAGEMKNWSTKAAAASGFPLAEQRQAVVNMNALRRAGGGRTGTSGESIVKGVDANDAYLGAADSASRELRDLGDAALSVTEPRRPFSNRNMDQMTKDVMGLVKEGALGLTGGLGHGAGLSYGMLNLSPAARKMILGDPVQRAAFIRALSPLADSAGTAGARALEE